MTITIEPINLPCQDFVTERELLLRYTGESVCCFCCCNGVLGGVERASVAVLEAASASCDIVVVDAVELLMLVELFPNRRKVDSPGHAKTGYQ